MPWIKTKTRNLRNEMFQKGLHWCSKCKKFLPVDQFYKGKQGHYGLAYVCKFHHRESQTKQVKTGDYWSKRTHKKRKKQAIKMAGICCQRCGYDEFSFSLCFHHIDPETKTKHFQFSLPLKRLLPELDRCILLCHNCHFAFHAGGWSAEFIKRDGLGWTIKQFELSHLN